MKVPHLTNDAHGHSQFGEIEIPQTGSDMRVASVIQETTGWRMAVHQPGLSADFHPTTAPTLLVVLSGELVITVSNGETRHLKRGDCLFEQDLKGQGHAAKFAGTEPCTTLTITMPHPGTFKSPT